MPIEARITGPEVAFYKPDDRGSTGREMTPKKEPEFRFEEDALTISGPSGVGKSTLAIRAANEFGLNRVNIGERYRQLVKKMGLDPDAANVLDPEIDHRLDNWVCDILRTSPATRRGRKPLVEARLAGWNATKVQNVIADRNSIRRAQGRPTHPIPQIVRVRMWLPDEVRFDRIWRRINEDRNKLGEPEITRDEAMHMTLDREQALLQRAWESDPYLRAHRVNPLFQTHDGAKSLYDINFNAEGSREEVWERFCQEMFRIGAIIKAPPPRRQPK